MFGIWLQLLSSWYHYYFVYQVSVKSAVHVHCRNFIGTALSTFSFRIHEDREILGFRPRTTFNCFCADADEKCEQPTNWVVMYS